MMKIDGAPEDKRLQISYKFHTVVRIQQKLSINPPIATEIDECLNRNLVSQLVKVKELVISVAEIISQTSDRYNSLNLFPYAVCWTIYFGGCSRERSSCGSEESKRF